MTISDKIKSIEELISTEEKHGMECKQCGGKRFVTKTIQMIDIHIPCECSQLYFKLNSDLDDLKNRMRVIGNMIPPRYIEHCKSFDISKCPYAISSNGRPKSYLIDGIVGNGKTTMLFQWMYYAGVVAGLDVMYVNYSDLCRGEFSGNPFFADVLIIDDFGINKAWNPHVLFSVINQRYNSFLPIWIATNNPQDMEQNVGKQIMDRIKDNSIPITKKDKSFRKFDAGLRG